MATNPSTLSEQLGDAANVLLLAPPRGEGDDRACIDLLTVSDPTETAVLSVTLTQSPADRLGVWERYTEAYPPAAAFVTVGPTVGDPAEPPPALDRAVPASTRLAVDRIDAPGDLRQIGVRVSERFGAWADVDHQIVLCIHSLSTLFHYTDLERVYRFLHVLTARVGGVAHYHLNLDAHDEETVELLATLFDVTVELDGEGDRHVRG